VGFFWRELFILNPPPLGGTAILPEYIHYYGLDHPPPPGGTAILREYIIILLKKNLLHSLGLVLQIYEGHGDQLNRPGPMA
jgi:hypothetical protein